MVSEKCIYLRIQKVSEKIFWKSSYRVSTKIDISVKSTKISQTSKLSTKIEFCQRSKFSSQILVFVVLKLFSRPQKSEAGIFLLKFDVVRNRKD